MKYCIRLWLCFLYFVSSEPAATLLHHCVDEKAPLSLPSETKSHKDILFSMSVKGALVAETVMGGPEPNDSFEMVCLLVSLC